MSQEHDRRHEDARLSALERRLDGLEDKVDQGALSIQALKTQYEGLPKMEMINAVVHPMEQSIFKMEHTVSVLAQKIDLVFAAHDELMKEEAKRKEELQAAQLEAARAQTVGATIKGWASTASAILTLFSLLCLSLGGLAWWIKVVLPTMGK